MAAGPIIQVTGDPQTSEAIQKAAEHLKEGRLVAFPTETVYGLGGRADVSSTVESIYRAKGRPSTNPLIVHVTDISAAKKYVQAWPDAAEKLAQKYWPGPLTLVLPSNGTLPDQVRAGQSTIALRVPMHPVAQALLKVSGLAIAAPSANRSGHISPSRAEHVLRSLREPIAMILDGGPSDVGVESTIVDVSGKTPMLLRHGQITAQEIEETLGTKIQVFKGAVSDDKARPSPGMSSRHYAPEARVVLFDDNEWAIISEELKRNFDQNKKSALLLLSQKKSDAGWIKQMPKDPKGYMREIYNALHEAEEQGCEFLAIELPPATPDWSAVHDRLHRAATPS